MNLKALSTSLSVALLMSASALAVAEQSAESAPPAMVSPQSANTSTALIDSAITVNVKAKYLDSNGLKGTDIHVNTANGVVVLTGSAPTADAKHTAEVLAKSVEGVNLVENNIVTPSVVNQLETQTKHAMKHTGNVASDSWITTKVKSSLLADSVTKGLNISVSTKNHVVVLAGVVDTSASVERAATLAKLVDGVVSVDTAGLKAASK